MKILFQRIPKHPDNLLETNKMSRSLVEVIYVSLLGYKSNERKTISVPTFQKSKSPFLDFWKFLALLSYRMTSFKNAISYCPFKHIDHDRQSTLFIMIF